MMIYKTVRFYIDIEVDAERDIVRDENGNWILTEESLILNALTSGLNQNSFNKFNYQILCQEDYMAGQICQLPLDHDGSHR